MSKKNVMIITLPRTLLDRVKAT